jgi:hypothetical protein
MPDYFRVAPCACCGVLYNEAMLPAGLCAGCDNDMDMFDQDDDDDYRPIDPNVCSECGDNTVQVQNGNWVCPGCDLWLY